MLYHFFLHRQQITAGHAPLLSPNHVINRTFRADEHSYSTIICD
jgi:hypothetical protein